MQIDKVKCGHHKIRDRHSSKAGHLTQPRDMMTSQAMKVSRSQPGGDGEKHPSLSDHSIQTRGGILGYDCD